MNDKGIQCNDHIFYTNLIMAIIYDLNIAKIKFIVYMFSIILTAFQIFWGQGIKNG